jgi:hypothetical protein
MVSVVLLSALAYAQKQKEPGKASNIKISVVKSTNGKPVRNASVILHPVNKDGRQNSGGVNLKTDADGEASFPGVPYGVLRIQVIAHGFQTYGEDFTVNHDEQQIVIKLKPPADQYSIYGDSKDKSPDKQDNQ